MIGKQQIYEKKIYAVTNGLHTSIVGVFICILLVIATAFTFFVQNSNRTLFVLSKNSAGVWGKMEFRPVSKRVTARMLGVILIFYERH